MKRRDFFRTVFGAAVGILAPRLINRDTSLPLQWRNYTGRYRDVSRIQCIEKMSALNEGQRTLIATRDGLYWAFMTREGAAVEEVGKS